MKFTSLLDDAPYLSEQTRHQAQSLFEALASKLELYAASKQDFETAYQAATYAYNEDVVALMDGITKDFLDKMPDVYKIGDKLPAGDGSWYYISETNILHENERSKISASYSYICVPEIWEDQLRFLYVEAASRSGA